MAHQCFGIAITTSVINLIKSLRTIINNNSDLEKEPEFEKILKEIEALTLTHRKGESGRYLADVEYLWLTLGMSL